MEQERILVVEDDEALRYMMVTYLQRRGYQVEGARDGLDGMLMLQTEGPFEVLVTDLMMPNMNGQRLLREARQLDPYLQMIVITAAPRVDSAIAAMRDDGAYDYLVKPLDDIAQLAWTVARAIANRRRQVERETLQARLRADAEQLQLLVANIGDAILSADAAGQLTIVNPAAARLLSRGDLAGGDALAALPRPLAQLVAVWQAVGARRPAVVEVAWPAGSAHVVSLAPMRLNGSQSNSWMMVIRNVTHLKRPDDPSRHRSDIDVEVTDVNLSWVADEVLTNLLEAPRFRSKALKLDVHLAQDLPRVRTDPDLIHKVLRGLISRAAARSEQGGTIRLATRAQQEHVWIEVGDDGPALDEGGLLHIFEKSFFGAHIASDSTALALAMVKAIVDRMGGQLWVCGQGHAGSTIALSFPGVVDARGEGELLQEERAIAEP